MEKEWQKTERITNDKLFCPSKEQENAIMQHLGIQSRQISLSIFVFLPIFVSKIGARTHARTNINDEAGLFIKIDALTNLVSPFAEGQTKQSLRRKRARKTCTHAFWGSRSFIFCVHYDASISRLSIAQMLLRKSLHAFYSFRGESVNVISSCCFSSWQRWIKLKLACACSLPPGKLIPLPLWPQINTENKTW